jgi:hypothetical protein
VQGAVVFVLLAVGAATQVALSQLRSRLVVLTGLGLFLVALRAHLRHRSTTGEARRRIRATYLDYARYYLSALEGNLPTEPGPQL